MSAILDKAADLAEKDQRDEALKLLLPYLDENVNDARALFIAGYIFINSDRAGLAYQVLKRAVELAPHEAVIWHNLGKACFEMRHLDEAEQCFRRAVKLNPSFAAALDGIALVTLNRCDYKLSMEYSKRALAADPNLADSKMNLGMSCLALRQWKEGWEGYNAKLGIDKNRQERTYGNETRWNGEHGKRVVAYGEQGIGDEISFASCIPDLIRDSQSVAIECDGRLEGLFRRSFHAAQVHGTRYIKQPERKWHEGKAYDYRVAFGVLPQFYRNRDEDFPGTPYLIPDPRMVLQWRTLLDSLGPQLKVGIAWTGGIKQTRRHARSVTLSTLLPILRNDAHFVSLQYETPQDLEEFEAKNDGIKIHHWPWATQLYDYDATAALVSQLDLVITVTTAIVHVAGGLGKECWCLVPQNPMWRYMIEGSDFPWAKSVTLYRQKGREWPIHILAAQLRERCDERKRQTAQCRDELPRRGLPEVRQSLHRELPHSLAEERQVHGVL